MSNTMKNTLVFLGVISLAYFGYTLQTQNMTDGLNFSGGEASATAYERTQSFIQYQAELSKVTLNQEVFRDSAFTGRVNYSPDLGEEKVGKNNPFLPTF